MTLPDLLVGFLPRFAAQGAVHILAGALPFSVVFASVGLSRARRLGGVRKRTALAALIAGIASLVVPLLLILAIAGPSAGLLA